jgi:hypothetical protein
MNKLRYIIAIVSLLIANIVEACWYPTYQPQYYLTYNLTDKTDYSPPTIEMFKMWQAIFPNASEEEINALIFTGRYSTARINSLNLPSSLKDVLKRNPALRRYIVLMRQMESECKRFNDPWYSGTNDMPDTHRLDSLTRVAKIRISGAYGDRYAVQAARGLRALKRYNEIITIAETHDFSDSKLKSLFELSLASAYYYTGNYNKALKIYRRFGDENSLKWTLEKLGRSSDNLAVARQLSFTPGKEAAIMRLLQKHILKLEKANDRSLYCAKLSLSDVREVISTAQYIAKDGYQCYKPIWQYTEGFAYLMGKIDYAKADSVFAKIDLSKASPHLKDQVRTLRFITQSYLRRYDKNYRNWFVEEASWLCERGAELMKKRRTNPSGYDRYYYKSWYDEVIRERNTHQSNCYPLDMLHRAVDCIVCPKMLAAGDTVGALQLMDVVDHAGFTVDEIQQLDSHGCASICFALESGADIVEAAQSSLNDKSAWSELIKRYGSIDCFPDRWNDLIGTLQIADARYDAAVKTLDKVSKNYAQKYNSAVYDPSRNPFAVQYISDPLCNHRDTKLGRKFPNHKKWFAQRMSGLKREMDNTKVSEKKRAKAAVEYYVGMANSVYPCWSLTRFGLGESQFFPSRTLYDTSNRRATEIIHDYISEPYDAYERPSKFDRSRMRLKMLRKESHKNLRKQIALLDANEAAEIYEKLGHYSTIKHYYADTKTASKLKSSCDRWSDW